MADRIQQAIDFFKAKGYSLAQAAGIVGNLQTESNLDPAALGDGGNAYGIAQWHPDRQALYKQYYGTDIQNSSYEQQLQFVYDELNRKETTANNNIKSSNSIVDAVKAMLGYERPAGYTAASGGVNVPSYSKRLTAANRAAAGLGDIDPALNPTIVGANNPVSNAVAAVGSGWNAVTGMFTAKFAGRTVAVVIGVAFIALAIAAFVLKSNPVEGIKNVA